MNDPRLIYSFASNVKGADIDKLQDAVIASGDARVMYGFASNVKGADIQKLKKAIKKAKERERMKKAEGQNEVNAEKQTGNTADSDDDDTFGQD